MRFVRREQRYVVVADVDGTNLVSLRLHLILHLADEERHASHLYSPERSLASTEIALRDTAIALATEQLGNGAGPSLLMVRTGDSRRIDPHDAVAQDRREYLRAEVDAYGAEWDTSA